MSGPALLQRRFVLASAAAALLVAGCGFKLRQAPDFVFSSIVINAAPASPLGNELRRSLAADGRLQVMDPKQLQQAQVIFDLVQEQRQKVVVGLSAAGQVREFQLRSRVKFKLRTPQGKELIPETELLQQRDISFNETAALSKEYEENLLYRDMQTDLVQQLMRRLASLKTL